MSSLCHLCERQVPQVTRHHLYPKSRARRRNLPIQEIPLADLCLGCHRQIHQLFSNRELAERLTSIEAIKQEPSVVTFLEWVRRQPSERRIRVR